MEETNATWLVETGSVNGDGCNVDAFVRALHLLVAEFADECDDTLCDIGDDVQPTLNALDVIRMALIALADDKLRYVEMLATTGFRTTHAANVGR